MLLGIIFVVHTSIGGDKLMFRYPAVTRGKVSDETMMAFRQQHPMMTPQGGANRSGQGGGGGGGGNEQDGNVQDQTSSAKATNTKDIYCIYNLSSEIITPILIPKPTLCDQSFELTIENTKFIGHPTVLDDSDSSDSEDDEKESYKKKRKNKNKRKEEKVEEDVHCSPSNRNGNPDLKKSTKYNSQPQQPSSQSSPIPQSSPQKSQPPTQPSSPANNNMSKLKEQQQQQQGKKKNNSSKDEITLFNVVFVLSSRVGDLNLNRDNSLKLLSLKIASTLKHEQNRCNYITNQAHEMMSIRDAWLTEHTLDTTSPEDKPNHEELTNRMLKTSRLAREIKDIYEGLHNNRMVSMRVNGWINLNLSISNPDHYSNYPIRPYHALLPFSQASDEASIQMPLCDVSPALQRLLEVAKPTKNFRDLQMETDLPLAQIYRLASHLVYWRKAKIINMMTKNNVYVLNPNANQEDIVQRLSEPFASLFPDFKFQDILVRFSTSRPLAEHISKFHQTYHVAFLQIVGWLLQHDVITQLHTYVHLMLMTPSSLHSPNVSPNTPSHLYQPTSFPLMPSQLQSHETSFFEKIDDNTKSYQLFKRLCPYFRGLHHLEEIMWRENISRDDLNKILKKYKSVLVQVTHEGEDLNNVQNQ